MLDFHINFSKLEKIDMTKVLFCSCKYGVGVIPYWYSLCVFVKYQYNEKVSIEH